MYPQSTQEKRVFSMSFKSVITNPLRMHKTTNHTPHYVITNMPPLSFVVTLLYAASLICPISYISNPGYAQWLYNGTKEKHYRQATMQQLYPTKTQTYKIIRVKSKIILYNRKQFMPVLIHRKRQGKTHKV